MKTKLFFLFMIITILSSEILSQNKIVTIDQRLSTNQQVGTLKKWEGSSWSNPFSPGTQFPFPLYSNQVILGDQAIYSNQKYNNWNSDFSNVKNHRSFNITPTTDLLLSNFIATNTGITIRTSLEGTSATGGVVEFRDPWFIDFQDAQFGNQLRNRGMQEAVFRQRTSPFYPNATTQYEFGQTYRGVFLNQPIVSSRPYYKVRVPDEQQISIHGKSRKFYPYYWTGSGVNYENANNRETGVVFTQSNATATAVLKGQLMSNEQNGISSNSQRKLVRTNNGFYHLVYESMNSIWLVTKADNWWAPEVKLASNAKNPSIDYFGDMLFIAYEEWENGQLKLGFIQVDTNSLSIIYSNSHYISTNQSDFGIVKPVVSCSQNQQFILYRISPNSGLRYRLRTLNGNNQWVWSQEYDVPFTNQNTLNWSVASNKLADYNIAFQQGITKIYYLHADPRGDTLRFCSLTDLSNATGYNYNYNPSISYFRENYDKVMISWTGIRQLYMDKKIAKTNVEDMTAHNAVVKVGYGGNFSNYSSFSNNVKFTNNNSLINYAGNVIAFSTHNGQFTKYVKRENNQYSNIQYLSNSGIFPLISNGNNFGEVKAVVFNSSTSAPYLLTECTNNFSQQLEKGNELLNSKISYGRSGILALGDLEFFFSIGDVLVNNSAIKFIERADTLSVNNIVELNNSLRTRDFYLSSESEIVFSNLYYVLNRNLADSLLTGNFYLNVKCQLVKSATGETVGTFDPISYNITNLSDYNNIGYLVNCDGIESGDYYLRLNFSTNENFNISMGYIQSDEFELNKKSLTLRNFSGKPIINEYSLMQNYPNPFNPSTTISWQSPVSGNHTIKLFDILGREIETIVDGYYEAGKHSKLYIMHSTLPSGVYFYQLRVVEQSTGRGVYVDTKKMMLVK